MNPDEYVFLTDSYKKELVTHIKSITRNGDLFDVVLEKTIFYPEGGGQAADKGIIKGKNGEAHVKDIRIVNGRIIHKATVSGQLESGGEVEAKIDWENRYANMRRHSAGHLLHEVIYKLYPSLVPLKGSHYKGKEYIEYDGNVPESAKDQIEKDSNQLITDNRQLTTKLVTFDQLAKEASYVPTNLPKNKPLRVLTVEGFKPIPDGGTQVKEAKEVGEIKVTKIENIEGQSKVYYRIYEASLRGPTSKGIINRPNSVIARTPMLHRRTKQSPSVSKLSLNSFVRNLLTIKNEASEASKKIIEPKKNIELKLEYLGSNGKLTKALKELRDLPPEDRKTAGQEANKIKKEIEQYFDTWVYRSVKNETDWLDVTAPGTGAQIGHLHIVTEAITEITRIFEQIGFTRVRYPEVEWEWYSFEGLNMPKEHPARDDFETFFIEGKPDPKLGKYVLSPHTSSGQVREMERVGSPPIRMVNIAKCYRRNWDISHTPMFHQFEGLVVDKAINITHLKGTMDYFAKQFFGPDRKTRLRPFHFQFTEPSFEVDITCDVCLGTGKLQNGETCRLCKAGWLELGGSGMVHPNVLKAGGIDATKYTGFAFGWGVERTYMMKSGVKIDDLRTVYNNDIRFLEQF
ncbi:MAG: Phenylalanine-tRNA ligase alpha subunit [Candidatus Gottesmanbacteria bacterium GW2011_GWC2_39_8]|uniref:Phenylalanine--tRNA ligase alpha subunit n=1 Tax=Candidatus Gottesmanbacteria bacterium GW2011_GWC2_39_8 TaxID=1618450 RepID=A0A0G0SA81_9BACT|nr:MAG: Phenylalanine-tRNA ligase alpha subunit [Candidatus Gottesmanbacteria bacterium GW2011_GWC2_39_8]